MKNAAFDVSLTCCTTMLNINENMLMDFMMANSNLFDSITQLLIRSSASHGYDVCLLLALLLQYHKYDVDLFMKKKYLFAHDSYIYRLQIHTSYGFQYSMMRSL